MRTLSLTASLLALAACNSDGSPDNNQAAVPAANAAAAAADARLTPRVLAAMAVLLADPGSALYSSVREGSAGSICGSIAVPRTDGTHSPPVPFVVTPEGVALLRATPQLGWDAPEDPFPPAYARWCATPQELEEMRARIAASRAPPPDEELPPPAEELPLEDQPAPPPPPPAQTRVPPAPRTPPVTPWEPADPNDVSFTNQVRRPDQ